MAQVIIYALIAVAQFLLPRLLAVLGVAVVSATTVTPIVEWLRDQVLAQFNGIPENFRLFLEFMGVYNAIGIVFSAYITLIGMKAAKAAFSKKASS